MSILEVQHISKTYGKGETKVNALNDVSFSVEQGEFVASSVRPVQVNQRFCISLVVWIRRAAVM